QSVGAKVVRVARQDRGPRVPPRLPASCRQPLVDRARVGVRGGQRSTDLPTGAGQRGRGRLPRERGPGGLRVTFWPHGRGTLSANAPQMLCVAAPGRSLHTGEGGTTRPLRPRAPPRQWLRRASISSSLSICERPSMSSSLARSCSSSTVQSSYEPDLPPRRPTCDLEESAAALAILADFSLLSPSSRNSS